MQTSYVNSDGSKIWSILSSDSLNFYDKNQNNVAFLYRTQTSENHQIMRMFGKDGISIKLSSGELYSILDDALMYYQNKKRHHNFYNDERHNGDSYFSRILLGSDDDNDVALSFASYEGRAVSVDGGLYTHGNLGCSGKKYRIVDTENYEKRLLCAYETPSPYFGDIGCGVIDENGICVISFDDIFLETVNTESQYQVFIQKEGEGDIWVEEKGFNYFSVKGTPFLKFSWEVKARQKDYDSERLEILREDAIEKDIDYEGEAMNMVLSYYNSLEGMFV